MLAHLMIGTFIGLVAAMAMAFSGAGALGVIMVYSAAGTIGLLGSATIAMVREDALDARI